MPVYRRPLDIYQGYNYKKDKQTPVGFITRLQLGGTTLPADQTCKDPTEPTQDLQVVAVLSDVMWETGVTDPLYFSGHISVDNRQTVALVTINPRTQIEVVLQFAIYDYDPMAKTYFLAFSSNGTDVKGLLEKKGDDINLSVFDEPASEVQSPENYAFQMGVVPSHAARRLVIATATQKQVVKSWGLPSG
ncbi:MAG: hypothetical protein R3F60_18385 [bacterium]